MGFVAIIIIGIAAGFLATRALNMQTDVPTTIAIGVGGAMLGGVLVRLLLTMMGWAAGLVGAVIGAFVLIWLWRTFVGR